MITELRIQNFRGLEDIRLTNLGCVNLIGGRNAIGKTSVLEAIWVSGCPTRPDIAYRVTNFRGIRSFPDETPFNDLFRDLNVHEPIRLTAHEDRDTAPDRLTISMRDNKGIIEPFANGSNKSTAALASQPRILSSNELVFEYTAADDTKYQTLGFWAEEPETRSMPFQLKKFGVYINPDHNLRQIETTLVLPQRRDTADDSSTKFSRLRVKGAHLPVLEFMNLIGPNVKDLVPINSANGIELYADIVGADQLMPLNFLGEGAHKALEIALAVATSQDGYVLIDELENGFHHSAVVTFFERLHTLARSTTRRYLLLRTVPNASGRLTTLWEETIQSFHITDWA